MGSLILEQAGRQVYAILSSVEEAAGSCLGLRGYFPLSLEQPPAVSIGLPGTVPAKLLAQLQVAHARPTRLGFG